MAVNTIGAGVVLNEGDIDVDFRVESDDNTHMLFVDGGDDAVIIGHSASYLSNGNRSAFQVHGTTHGDTGILESRWSNDALGPIFTTGKSRSGTIGTFTIVQDGDLVGSWLGVAADGVDFVSQVAQIQMAIDGTPGANDTPGRIVFQTTADGAQGTTERMRIDSYGNVGIGASGDNLNTRIVRGFSANKGLVIETAQPAIHLVDTADTDKYLNIVYDNGTAYFYNQASGDTIFSTNAAERMRLDSSGTLILNTAASDEKLSLKGSTTPYIRWYESTTAKAFIQWHTSGYLQFTNEEHSESFYLADNGVGIGTASVNSNAKVHIRGGDSGQTTSSNNTHLTVEGSGNTGIQLLAGTGNVAGIWVGDSGGAEDGKLYYSNSTATWSLDTAGTPRMTIHADAITVYGETPSIHKAIFYGNHWRTQFVRANSSNSDGDQIATWINSGDSDGYHNYTGIYALAAGNNGSGRWEFKTNSGAAYAARLSIAADGTFAGSGSADISDQLLKKNISTVTNGLSTINQLRGVTYDWIVEADMPEGKHYGLIAQELEEVLPDLVSDKQGIRKKDDGTWYKSITTSGVIPVLIEAIKELTSKVEALENA